VTANIFSFSSIGPRLINQVLFSLFQLILNLLFLRYFSIADYGAITSFQILINFYMGFNINSIIYYCNFNIVSKTRIFLKISTIFFAVFLLFGLLFLNILKISLVVALLLMLRIHNNVLLEFNNRLTFNIFKSNKLYRFGIIRLFEILSILIFYFVFSYDLEFIIIFLLIFESLYFILSFSLIRQSFSLDNNQNKKLKLDNNLKYNLLYYLSYYAKAQITPIILSLMSLEMMGVFSGTRFLATPFLILTPVISSLLLSSYISINQQIKKIKDKLPVIIIGTTFYIISVIFISEYFYLYFFGKFNSDLLIFTLLHILLALLATIRSIIETIYQTKKFVEKLFKINLVILTISLIINSLFIYLLGINGAIISMIIIELSLIIFLKIKYENIL
jgi:O-antigen/teichoic acid export membrane protein